MRTGSLYIPRCPRTHYVGQIGLEFEENLLRLKASTPMPGHNFLSMGPHMGSNAHSGAFKGQYNRNSISGIVGFLGFVLVNPGISIDAV